MKYLIAMILMTAGIACTAPEVDPEVNSKAMLCLDENWNDMELAQHNGLNELSHRELYDACVISIETDKRFMNRAELDEYLKEVKEELIRLGY